jgi:hypothetical protein
MRIIGRLMEMGFRRERALDALEITRPNCVETAIDDALSNDPSSPSAIARRRMEREGARLRIELEEWARRHTAWQNSSLNDAADVATSPHVDNTSDQSGGGTAMDVDRARSMQENEDKDYATPATRTGGYRALAMTKLESWIEIATQVTCNLLDRVPRPSPHQTKLSSGQLSNEEKIREGARWQVRGAHAGFMLLVA